MKITDISKVVNRFLESKESSVLNLEFKTGDVVVFKDITVTEFKYDDFVYALLPTALNPKNVKIRNGFITCEFNADDLVNIEVIEVSK